MPTNVLALDSARERLAKARYSAEEIERILVFLQKFCGTAAIYLTNFFVAARKKPFGQVMRACHGYDQLVWQYSSPDRYGDPDDVGVDRHGDCLGMKNANAIAGLYAAVELPLTKGIH